ncbi:MAG: hypothetical protein ACTSWE_02370 [Promethearchaeota archaeon]
MKKEIIILILGIFLINIISAIELGLEAGENHTIDLGAPYAYYTITQNSTPIDINITLNGNTAIIQTSKYIKDDKFRIVFYGEDKVKSVFVGGGGGDGGDKTTPTTLSQKNDSINSATTNGGEETDNQNPEANLSSEPKTPLRNFYNAVGLGGVVGTLGTAGTTGALALILGALGGLIFVGVRKKKKLKN